MASKPLKISVNALETGMYICELDRPWNQTPFPIHGFYVRELDEVKQLKVHCNHVYIDPSKGKAPDLSHFNEPNDSANVAFRGKLTPLKPTLVYTNTTPLKKEMAVAQAVYDEIIRELDLTLAQAANHCLNSVDPLIAAAGAMVDTLINNPDSFVWLIRVRKMIGLPNYYLLRSATWAILCGRHLGLPKGDLRVLAISCLLKDIGRFGLDEPPALEEHNILSDANYGASVIESSISLLRGFSSIVPKVIKTIRACCENINGSGFPGQLRGDDIFLLSKIVGISSYYDQVAYPMGSKCAVPSSISVSKLYEIRAIRFQDELVTEFIKAIGLYPTGTLVKLSSDHIVVIIEQNYQRRLRPIVAVIIDNEGNVLEDIKIVDLLDDSQCELLLKQASRNNLPVERLDLVQDIDPLVYPIKVTKIRENVVDYFAKKTLFSLFGRR